MSTLANFTKTLIISFVLTLVYLFLPSDLVVLGQILKYSILISIIIALMSYKSVIQSVESGISNINSPKRKKDGKYEFEVVLDEKKTTKDLFQRLIILTIKVASSINKHSHSAIYTIDPKINSFVLQGGKKDEFKESISIENGELLNFVLKSRKIHQKDNKDLWNSLFSENSWKGSESAIINPVKIHGKDLGFILCRIDHFKNISDKDLSSFKNLSEFFSYNLQNLDDLDYHINQEASKDLILDIISGLNSKTDEQNIFDQFRYFFRTTFNYDRLTISIRKETNNRRKIDKAINSIVKLTDGIKDELDQETEFPTNGTLHGLPIISGKSISSSNWQESFPNIVRYSSKQKSNAVYKTILGSPILVGNQAKGSIVLERLDEVMYAKKEVKNLEKVGRILGSSLEWVNEYNKIYENATHDGLSGLLNHQTFKERFNDEIKRAERFQHKMSIMIFDLDKFKNINDTLGHQYGDYIIQTCSKIMKDNVRAVDVVARYGGEEFAIILINTSVIMSNIVAQRIVDTIANYPFKMDNIKAKMTISGGMSEYPSDSKDMKELIEIADQAMYSSKQEGGNKFSIHSNIEKSG